MYRLVYSLWQGWRKHLVRVRHVWSVSIHSADECKDAANASLPGTHFRACRVRHVNISEGVWIKHNRTIGGVGGAPISGLGGSYFNMPGGNCFNKYPKPWFSLPAVK